jgi:signal transduction histidine kinase
MSAKSFLLIGLLFFYSVSSICQINSDKEMTMWIQQQNADGVNLDSLISVCKSMIYSNPDSAIVMSRYLLELAAKEESREYEIQTINLQGIINDVRSQYDSALYYYNSALNLAIATENFEQTGNIYNNIGLTHWHVGSYKEALDNFFKALGYNEQAGNIEKRAGIINNIGIIYGALGNNEKAVEFYFKAYDDYQAFDDSLGMGATLTNLGYIYLNNQKLDSAEYYLDESIKIKKATRDNYGLCISLEGRARILVERSDYDSAKVYLDDVMNLATQINYQYGVARVNLGYARLYLSAQQPQIALDYAHMALNIAKSIGNNKLEYQIHSNLSDIYKQMQEYESAFKHQSIFNQMKDESLDRERLHQIYHLELKHAEEKNMREMQQLIHEKEIQSLEIDRKEMQIKIKNIIIISILSILLLLLTGGVLIYHNLRFRQRDRLQKTIISLTEKKSRDALEAEIRERKRIGQELHDGLGQMLSVARLNISAIQQKGTLSPGRQNEMLSSAITSVDAAFNELRTISHNLAPSVLSEKGLILAVKELVDQINRSSQIRVDLEIVGMNGSIDSLLENTIYRAIQELLNNAINHAKASDVFLQILKNESEITVMVEDNGKGFELNKTFISEGGGLSNIRSRVENLDGELFVDTMENRGTIITIVIPVKKEEYV